MRIIKETLSSRCKDGSLVKEYTLHTPIDDADIERMKGYGEVSIKDLGGNKLFTCTSPFFLLKGMITDIIIYVTFKKEDQDSISLILNQIFG